MHPILITIENIAKYVGADKCYKDMFACYSFVNTAPHSYEYSFRGWGCSFQVKGTVCGTINGCPYTVTAPAITFFPQYQRIKENFHSPDFECKVIFIADTLVSSIGLDMELREQLIHRAPSYQISPEQMDKCLDFYDTLKTAMNRDFPYKDRYIKSLLDSWCLNPDVQLYMKKLLKVPYSTEVDQFFNMVQLHFKKHDKVSFYAGLLGISIAQLERILRLQTGKSALQWINLTRVQYAQQQLQYSDKTIKTIAFELGFSSTAYFSTFFKRHLGVSPADYRKTEKIIVTP